MPMAPGRRTWPRARLSSHTLSRTQDAKALTTHSRLSRPQGRRVTPHRPPPRLARGARAREAGGGDLTNGRAERGGGVALQKIRLCVRLTNAILRVLTHRGRFYFLPNFLSTGFGERFCALWRMLHLASAAANSKRWGGGQDRVTPRRQAGAELRISTRSLLAVSRCFAATATGCWAHRGPKRVRSSLGVCIAP